MILVNLENIMLYFKMYISDSQKDRQDEKAEGYIPGEGTR